MSLALMANTILMQIYKEHIPKNFYSFLDKNNLLEENPDNIQKICQKFEQLKVNCEDNKIIIVKEILEFLNQKDTPENIKNYLNEIFEEIPT